MEGDTTASGTISFFDCVVEALECIDRMAEDDSVSKRDLVDSIRSRLHDMIPKILTRSHFSASTVAGWRIDALA